MRPNDAKLSYNNEWAFLQFDVADMNFHDMTMLMDDIFHDNKSPLPFNYTDTTNVFFKKKRGGTVLEIKLDEEQYGKLREFSPKNELKRPTSKHLLFQLTMPNVGSHNGKWTAADKKFFIHRKVDGKFFDEHIAPLQPLPLSSLVWFHDFGDGWGANVTLKVVDADTARKAMKTSSGFAGYDWMVDSILKDGTIKTEQSRKLEIA
jgi:hypothetical protein